MPTPPSNTYPIRREKSFPAGRLIVLQTTVDAQTLNLRRSAYSIDFPAMPDQIELARTTNYVVKANLFMPDGIHQYVATNPLEIPFSFKIHHADREFCAEGPMTLLKIAARLHALVTPLGDSTARIQVGDDGSIDSDGIRQPGTPPPKTDVATDKKPLKATASAVEGSKTDPPVVCRLELIYTGLETPGILCTGYVKDVKATLFGPWLRGPNESTNLPSAGEYAFTFVHRPGHGNFFTHGGSVNSAQPQAYSEHIRDRLYNTRDLQSTAQFRGWLVTKP